MHQYPHELSSESKQVVGFNMKKQLLGSLLASDDIVSSNKYLNEVFMTTLFDEGAYNYVGYISRHVLKLCIDSTHPLNRPLNNCSKYEDASTISIIPSKLAENPERLSYAKK